jgi:hypothetical protein
LESEIQREIPIDNYIVDGLLNRSKTVFEYNGCYFHCHHCVYKNNRDEKITLSDGTLSKKTPNEIFNDTLNKKAHFRKKGYNFVEEWDCSLKKKREEDKSLYEYIDKRWKQYSLIDKFGGVNVKESFFGGRTNNIKFYCDVSSDINKKYFIMISGHYILLC